MKKIKVIANKHLKQIKHVKTHIKHIRSGAQDVCYLGCGEEVELA